MLKTNSKKARENVRNYIEENLENYIEENLEYFKKDYDFSTFSGFAHLVYDCFIHEFYVGNNQKMSYQNAFIQWAQGLAMYSLFDYYYNISAVDLLGNILDETPTEKARFTECQAEELLSKLIYSEVVKNL